jgi:hypothetical protein
MQGSFSPTCLQPYVTPLPCTCLETVSLADNLVDADDALVTDLANMQQPDGAVAQVQEGAVRPQTLHNALDDVTNLREHGASLSDGNHCYQKRAGAARERQLPPSR